MENKEKKKKKLGLTTQIFIALALGAVVGIVLNYLVPDSDFKQNVIINGVLYVVGQGFIRLMQMLVVPLVLTSLVCGSMSIGDTKKLGAVGVRTLCFYIATTAIAITVALCIGNLINPGVGLDMSAVQQSASTAGSVASNSADKLSLAETILDIIPTNIFNGLSEASMLQVIFFALVLGVILAKLGDSADTVSALFSQGNDIMMEMTMMVMSVAPVGVFCLIAKTFSTIGFNAFIPLLKYMLSVFIALGVQAFVVYMSFLKVCTGLNPIKFIRKFFPVMAFAFSTSTSNATIPLSIETLDKKIGVSRRISSFTIPLGATINMDGTSIMQGVAVVFRCTGFWYSAPYDGLYNCYWYSYTCINRYSRYSSAGLITLTMVFNSVGLPVEGIALIMGIDRILDMTRTAVNITGDAVCTTIVANQNKALDKEKYNNMDLIKAK